MILTPYHDTKTDTEQSTHCEDTLKKSPAINWGCQRQIKTQIRRIKTNTRQRQRMKTERKLSTHCEGTLQNWCNRPPAINWGCKDKDEDKGKDKDEYKDKDKGKDKDKDKDKGKDKDSNKLIRARMGRKYLRDMYMYIQK